MYLVKECYRILFTALHFLVELFKILVLLRFFLSLRYSSFVFLLKLYFNDTGNR